MLFVKIAAVIVFLMVIAIVLGSFMHEDFAELEPDDDHVSRHPTFRKPL
jgi:hypothetical protein